MKLIEEFVAELTDLCSEYNSEKDVDVKNMKLDLLITKLEMLELNLNEKPLKDIDNIVKNVLKQLLFKHKFKAITELETLKQTADKRMFNSLARNVIKSQLFFQPLYKMMQRNVYFYTYFNRLENIKEFEIFILKECEGDSNE
ncbi:hypothetical protein RJD24_14645 [Bacillaceae bacterium IKA-2]|nr:hypothetical protein RJD24_14645 [Bacillaceae bacterium IKA-2]